MSAATVSNGGKLTGWAQAAARAIPAQQQQQQPRPTTTSPSPTHKQSSNSVNSTANTTGAARTKRKPTTQPYNRDEVRSYMNSLFKSQTNAISSESTYTTDQQRKSSLDWGTVTNSKYRNKKYGCLNDIAQALWK